MRTVEIVFFLLLLQSGSCFATAILVEDLGCLEQVYQKARTKLGSHEGGVDGTGIAVIDFSEVIAKEDINKVRSFFSELKPTGYLYQCCSAVSSMVGRDIFGASSIGT